LKGELCLASLQSIYFKYLVRIIGRKRFWKNTGSNLQKKIKQRRKSIKVEPPVRLIKKLHIEKKEKNHHTYFEINPRQQKSDKHLLYFHGGGYVNGITKYHWDFIEKIAEETKCSVTLPLYPLAPEYTYKDVFDFITPVYEQALTKRNPDNLIIMGDSAGGGMALALAQYLKEKKISQPKNIVLISPWLDITLSNPDIVAIEKQDPFLAKSGAVEAGRMYAGKQDPLNYLISPLYGDLKGLGKISMFIGTNDIMYPDTILLNRRIQEIGEQSNYFEFQDMFHVFPLFSFPEALHAKKQIIEIIQMNEASLQSNDVHYF